MVAAAVAAPAFDHEHALWTDILKGTVNDGNVAYVDLVGDDKRLNKYLAQLSAVTPDQFNGWKDRQKMAFWINAHNAFAVRAILDHHPVDSVKALGMGKTTTTLQVRAPAKLTLADIEDELTHFTDVRVVFALTNGTRGSPALRPSAYRADALDAQLEDAAYAFINDPDRNLVDVSRGVARLSPLFKDHRKLFEAQPRGLPGFLSLYVDAESAEKMRGTRLKIEFCEMDWALNGR